MQEPCSVPLGIAAAKGHTETVHRLLVLGADINHQNKVMIIADPRLSLFHAQKSVLGFLLLSLSSIFAIYLLCK